MGTWHEILTISNAAKALTATVYNPTGNERDLPSGAVISVVTDHIRFWADGGTPVADEGIRAKADTYIELESPAEVKLFRAIRENTDAKIHVQYFPVEKPA